MTQQKVKLLYSSFAVESMVDIQLHPQVSKAAWLTIISCGVEDSWGHFMQESFKLQGRLRISVGKIIPLGWVTSFIREQNRE